MTDIDIAIKESKNKENISNGGSMCFDFGDVVLVKYSCPTKYLKNGERSREKSEEIMEAIKTKADNGVNTPRHLVVKRVIEGENDICYVLQQKCPGHNCASLSKYGVSFDEMCDSLKFILNIPFEHYKKLIEDGFDLFEMGYEAKNKNLFYDSNSGFWFIDFLNHEKDYMFDSTDVKKIFEGLNYRIPKPIQISSSIKYNEKLTDEQKHIENELKYAIKAKTLLAIKEVLPNFEKYEKFFLFEESDDYKKYLMQNKLVKKDLTSLDSIDYEVFQELYEMVIKGLIDKIKNKGEKFWNIERNDIKNDSNLFNLQSFFEQSKYNSIKPEEFYDTYDYEYEVRELYTINVLNDLIGRLEQMEPNENITSFLTDASEKLKSHKNL